jgi:hypothetical protein
MSNSEKKKHRQVNPVRIHAHDQAISVICSHSHGRTLQPEFLSVRGDRCPVNSRKFPPSTHERDQNCNATPESNKEQNEILLQNTFDQSPPLKFRSLLSAIGHLPLAGVSQRSPMPPYSAIRF